MRREIPKKFSKPRRVLIMKDFNALYAELKAKFNAALIDFLRPYEKTVNENLYDAMKYSVVNSGKRIRPILCMLGARFAGADEEKVMTFAIAAELIHTYSLVHDDLPAVDNDSMRRGKLTTHVMHGEAMGVFAGDALLNLAYEIMTENVIKTTDFKRLRAMGLIMKAAGANGLLNGQAKDVDYDNCGDYFLEHIIAMYRNKTADLIRASLVAGALIGGAENRELEALSSFGDSLGIYFQLQDDLMDEGAEKIDMNMSVDDYLASLEDEDSEENQSENGGIDRFKNEKTGSIFDMNNSGNSDKNGGVDQRFKEEKEGSIFNINNNGNSDKDGGINPRFQSEKTSAFGVNAEGVLMKKMNPASDIKGDNNFDLYSFDISDKKDFKNTDGHAEQHKINTENISHAETKRILGLDKPVAPDTSDADAPKVDSRKLLGLDKTADELLYDNDSKIDGKTLLRMGKEQNASEMLKSAKREKMTFLKAAGEDETRKLMAEYADYVRETVLSYGDRADELIGLFEFIKTREN
jgi:geranylgeranyl diphosphate synthase type II